MSDFEFPWPFLFKKKKGVGVIIVVIMINLCGTIHALNATQSFIKQKKQNEEKIIEITCNNHHTVKRFVLMFL